MEVVQQILEEMAAVGRTKRSQQCPAGTDEDAEKPGRRTGYTSRQCTGYTGLNTLLAVEEYGNILGYANRQQARVEPGELEVHTVLSSDFQSVSERATQAMPDLRGSNTSLFCSHCGQSQCCNTSSLNQLDLKQAFFLCLWEPWRTPVRSILPTPEALRQSEIIMVAQLIIMGKPGYLVTTLLKP